MSEKGKKGFYNISSVHKYMGKGHFFCQDKLTHWHCRPFVPLIPRWTCLWNVSAPFLARLRTVTAMHTATTMKSARRQDQITGNFCFCLDILNHDLWIISRPSTPDTIYAKTNVDLHSMNYIHNIAISSMSSMSSISTLS